MANCMQQDWEEMVGQVSDYVVSNTGLCRYLVLHLYVECINTLPMSVLRDWETNAACH